MTVHKLRPVADGDGGVEVEARRTGHEGGGEADTLEVEAAVVGMRNIHSQAVLTLVTDHIELNVFVQ